MNQEPLNHGWKMKDMEYIKEYYDTRFRVEGMPPFEKLNEDDYKIITNSTAYACWKIGKHFQEIGLAIKKYWNKYSNGKQRT